MMVDYCCRIMFSASWHQHQRNALYLYLYIDEHRETQTRNTKVYLMVFILHIYKWCLVYNVSVEQIIIYLTI